MDALGVAKKQLEDISRQIVQAQNDLNVIKKQIEGMSKTRDDAVTEINNLLEGRKVEAGKVIEDAKAQATTMIADAQKVKDDNIATSTVLASDRAVLTGDQALFEAYRTNSKAEIEAGQAITANGKADIAEQRATIKPAQDKIVADRQALDQTAARLSDKEKELKAWDAKIVEESSLLLIQQNAIAASQSAIDKMVTDAEVLKPELEKAIADNKATADRLTEKAGNLEADRIKLNTRSETLTIREAKAADDEATVTQKNEAINLGLTDIAEQKETLHELKNSLAIQSRALNDKIAILQQLRADKK